MRESSCAGKYQDHSVQNFRMDFRKKFVFGNLWEQLCEIMLLSYWHCYTAGGDLGEFWSSQHAVTITASVIESFLSK